MLETAGRPECDDSVGQPMLLMVGVRWWSSLVVGSYRAGTSFRTWYFAPSTRST